MPLQHKGYPFIVIHTPVNYHGDLTVIYLHIWNRITVPERIILSIEKTDNTLLTEPR